MNPLRESIQDYLALRRSLGFKLRDAGICLSKFAAFLEARGAAYITTQLAMEWAQQSQSVLPSTCAQRLGHVRSFARHHVASDPQTEIPPPGLLPFRPRRAHPYLYSEEEIDRLLRCHRPSFWAGRCGCDGDAGNPCRDSVRSPGQRRAHCD